MIDDVALDLLVAVYVIAAAIEVYVAYRLVPPARQQPHIDVLSGAAVASLTLAFGGIIGALLGVNGVVYAATDNIVRLIPQWLSLPMLGAALLVPAAGAIYMLRLVRNWDRQRSKGHVHVRDGEPVIHPHRRATDPPPTEGPDRA